MSVAEAKQNDFVEFFEKFTNFYKFVRESTDIAQNLWEIPDVGPVLAATQFVPKIRRLRKEHPQIVTNIKTWAKDYYKAKDSCASTSGLRSSAEEFDKVLLEQNIVDLASVYKPDLAPERIKALMKDNIDTAVRLIRYLDLFFDLSIIPD